MFALRLLFGLIGLSLVTGQAPSPLAKAHDAIGGAAHIAAVRTLLMKGVALSDIDEIRGPVLDAEHPVELKLAFPDRYVRIGPSTRSGFSGLTPIRIYPPPPAGARILRTPPNWVSEQKYPVVRWLLGIFADTKGMMDVVIAPAPGDPNLLLVSGPPMRRASGPDRFAASIDLDPATGMPLRVRYQDDLWIVRARTEKEEAAGRRLPGRVERVEVIISFEDRRLVDGLMLPHRIVRTVKVSGGKTSASEALP